MMCFRKTSRSSSSGTRRKDTRAPRSSRSFCIGVPVRHQRLSAEILDAASWILVDLDFMWCATHFLLLTIFMRFSNYNRTFIQNYAKEGCLEYWTFLLSTLHTDSSVCCQHNIVVLEGGEMDFARGTVVFACFKSSRLEFTYKN